MIFDSFENLERYVGLGEHYETAIRYFLSGAWQTLPLGNHPVAGEWVRPIGNHPVPGGDVLVQVQEYVTRPEHELKWEAHHFYSDLQCIVAGTERMGYGTRPDFVVTEHSLPNDDIYHLRPVDTVGDFFDVKTGMFTIFTPQDVHKTRITADDKQEAQTIRKIIFKIRESVQN